MVVMDVIMEDNLHILEQFFSISIKIFSAHNTVIQI